MSVDQSSNKRYGTILLVAMMAVILAVLALVPNKTLAEGADVEGELSAATEQSVQEEDSVSVNTQAEENDTPVDVSFEGEDTLIDTKNDTNDASEAEPQNSLTAAPQEAPAEQLVSNGAYVIETGVKDSQVVDVDGGKKNNKTNVQTYTYNASDAQKWSIQYDKKSGWYYIAMKGTNLVLDVNGGTAKAGTNVQLYQKNGSDAQLWSFEESGDGYKIVSKLGNDLVLDVSGGKAANKTNICVYTDNGSKAQKFHLLPLSPQVAGSQTIKDGVYNLTSTASGSYALDVAGGTRSNKGNVQIYSKNDSSAQKLYFEYDGSGFYTITFLNSGKVLDLAGSSLLPGTNIQQYDRNNTDAQKWAVRKNNSGSYSLVNKATGLVLDVSGGLFTNGRNVLGYRDNGTAAQQFKFTKTEFLNEGIYTIHAFDAYDQVLDVKGASIASKANLQLYKSNDTLAQRYQVVRAGENTYRLRAAASGRWVVNNTNDSKYIIQKGSSSTGLTDPNTWYAVWNGSYFSLKNKSTGKILELVGGKTTNGTLLQSGNASKTHKQYFYFVPANLVAPGLYEIVSELGTTLDVAGASTAAGANIQAYKANNSNAQKFYLEKTASSWKIKNYASDKVVAVSGSDVRQASYSGAKTQLWTPIIQDGGYIGFQNLSNKLVLDIVGGSAKSGANVQTYKSNESAAQHWKLKSTSPEYVPTAGTDIWNDSAYINKMIARAKSTGSLTKWFCTVDKSKNRVCVLYNNGSTWILAKTMNCITSDTYTFTGTFKVDHKNGAYYDGSHNINDYWTCFLPAYSKSNPAISGYTTKYYPGKGYDDGQGFHYGYSSGGCTVVSNKASVKYIYDNVSLKSTVQVF